MAFTDRFQAVEKIDQIYEVLVDALKIVVKRLLKRAKEMTMK
jgi:hypothetical protein